MFNKHLPYGPDLAPCDFHFFLHFKKFLSGQRQHFQNGRDECHCDSNPRQQTSAIQDTKVGPMYDKCLNSGGEYVEKCSALAVFVLRNLSIKLGFVSVNSPRETYFVDALHICLYSTTLATVFSWQPVFNSTP